MAIVQVADGAVLTEALARILADGFEESIPTAAVAIAPDSDQRFADEPRQKIEHMRGIDPSPPHTCSAVSSVQEAGEHGQTAEQEPFTL